MVFHSVLLFKIYVCKELGRGLCVGRKVMILGLVLGIPSYQKTSHTRELSPGGRQASSTDVLCFAAGCQCSNPMWGVKTWWRGGSQIDETLNCQFNLYDPSHHLRCIFGKKKSKWNPDQTSHQLLKIEHDVKGQDLACHQQNSAWGKFYTLNHPPSFSRFWVGQKVRSGSPVRC